MLRESSVSQEFLPLFAETENVLSRDTTSTFADNLSLPIHRWFRYSAGFSASWVHEIIEREKLNGRARVLDPFSGSGTVLIEGERAHIESIGIEAHPFVARISRAKLHWSESPQVFRQFALSVLASAKELEIDLVEVPDLLKKCFPAQILTHLEALKQSWEMVADGSACSELTWLALASILRACSPVGTAQWQYVLPNKSKAKIVEPYEAFEAKVALMCEDMRTCQHLAYRPAASIYWRDAREGVSEIPDKWADLVITSPPYANNYDYADATRLEMTFFGDIQGWGDLQSAVRKYLVRSCTQHVGSLSKETYKIIADPLLLPIYPELLETCKLLDAERQNHGGKKQYHTMIASYFSDLARVWVELRRMTAPGALICFVVGDSAPYGIHVPVDCWLGELALAAGFTSYSFEKTRDRNVKWKNRKHTHPLHEGRLWVKG